jgi:hypothetical protein
MAPGLLCSEVCRLGRARLIRSGFASSRSSEAGGASVAARGEKDWRNRRFHASLTPSVQLSSRD